MNTEAATTQRAYTLRLRGASTRDQSWREALWMTHEAVNQGAQAFGDWLLTLRGGLDHTLTDVKVKGKKGAPDRDPTDEERKARRILLALSWLSVESKHGAPKKFSVASGEEPDQERIRKLLGALHEILRARGLSDQAIAQWKDDCRASLSAAIRDDAVWVNRSKAFDEARARIGALDRDYARSAIQEFFGAISDYFAPPKDPKEKRAREVDDNVEFRELARAWLSRNWGSGEKSDKKSISRTLRDLLDSDLLTVS